MKLKELRDLREILELFSNYRKESNIKFEECYTFSRGCSKWWGGYVLSLSFKLKHTDETIKSNIHYGCSIDFWIAETSAGDKYINRFECNCRKYFYFKNGGQRIIDVAISDLNSNLNAIINGVFYKAEQLVEDFLKSFK